MWLKQGFEGVIIHILVEIERSEDVECAGKVYRRWNRCSSVEDGQQMRGANDRISVHDGHDPGPVTAVVWFEDPHSIVWIRFEVRLAEFMNEGAFDNLLSNRKRKKQVYPGNVDAARSTGGIVRQPSVENNAVLSGCHEATGFPFGGTADCLAVQSSEA